MEEDRCEEIIREVLEHWDEEEWEVPAGDSRGAENTPC